MLLARTSLAMLLAVGSLAAFLLAGSMSGESSGVSAFAGAPLIGGLIDELKREDDETEAREIRAHEPLTREERAEAREAAEAAQVQSDEAAEGAASG